jgi:hypothetical protein
MLKLIKTNFVKFKKRYKFIILIFLLIYFLCNFLTISLSQDDEEIKLILSPENLIKKVVIGEYTFRCYIGPPPFRENVFQIYKNDELVYQSDTGYAYWLGKKEGLFHPGDDITGDGIPNLVVMYSSGGNSSFNQFCYVFSLGDQFRLIQCLPQGNFVDINQDGKLDCIAYQPGFTFWHACHAGSPLPKIVYEYCDNEYLLAPALMCQPLPEEEEMNQVIEEVKRRCAKVKEEEWDNKYCWNYKDVYLDSSVWSYMLKLMFSGHPDEAYDFLDKVWPEGEKGKSYFIYDFEELLNETIWPALEPMFDRIVKIKKENPSASLEDKITQGIIHIWAYPENTKVYLNDQYLGEAPLSTDFLAPGEYNIRLSHLGYYDVDITAEVVPLHIQKVEDSLKQKEGNSTLFVTSNPEKAEVCLDNTYIGLTPLKIKKISPGEHSLAFIKPDYHLCKEIIQIYSGEDHEITADLQPKVQERTLFEEYPFIEEKLFLIGLVIFSFVVLFFKDL